ncbi:thermonuclease family protein [Sphingomonas populi]|uniref:Thermonuclease family protein n=1 Tax=Sphingomonas populi TaxID=2484750 RepID=A0A4Q6Y1X8_9SPHN|nr:thermonuclease family protein [Sphingomonas populi]RZF63237.1 thermonuclease family protein [Sphingomonas populi]
MSPLNGLNLAFLAALLGACSPSIAEPDTTGIEGKARAIDGDTVAIDFRLLGADAFERKQWCEMASGCAPCGKAAQDFAARFLARGPAMLRLTGQSSYGRPVAIAEVAGRDLGEAMIRAGYAVPRPGFLDHDPDRRARYLAAFAAAQEAKAGAMMGQWIDPAKWRKGDRLSCERERHTSRDWQQWRKEAD